MTWACLHALFSARMDVDGLGHLICLVCDLLNFQRRTGILAFTNSQIYGRMFFMGYNVGLFKHILRCVYMHTTLVR